MYDEKYKTPALTRKKEKKKPAHEAVLFEGGDFAIYANFCVPYRARPRTGMDNLLKSLWDYFSKDMGNTQG